jgi:predicted ATPase/DNA-binding XRE family transcriptional regulator
LRDFRVAAQLTQEELADHAGLSPRGISDLERGVRRVPRLATLRRLSEALQLDTEDRAVLEAAARAASRPARQRVVAAAAQRSWPGPSTGFIGRTRELRELGLALRAHRLVTLAGTGGIGKTRLALAVAEQHVRATLEAPVVVELAALADPMLVPRATAAALQLAEQATDSIVDALSGALAARDLLLVFDNCEHLLGACGSLASQLLDRCPRLRILATSREPLRIGHELVWPVPPLDVGNPDETVLERIAQHDAVRLFVDRGRAVRPTFELTDANAPVVLRVCRRLDSIPLAIELAAARLRVLSVEQIDTRLEDSYRILVWGAADAPERHQTLLATVDWSYALLADDERALFDRLAVFRGGAWLEAIEDVCGSGSSEASRPIVDVLQSLVEKSLVLAEPARDGSVRFGQLETLRQ